MICEFKFVYQGLFIILYLEWYFHFLIALVAELSLEIVMIHVKLRSLYCHLSHQTTRIALRELQS